ncbi:MAG: hypothetical protein NC200_00145 [Candidatus Gastranaerophilales bacterium]|nr:hypothetical protein [Candidatus Gastranaerophilales bacterium]
MSLDTSNTFDRFRNMHTTTCSGGAGATGCTPVTSSVTSDSYSFTYGMSENLRYSQEKSIAGPVFEGTLNGKDTTMKIVADKDKVYYEGVIDGKKIMLEVSENNYKGIYGDKEINLNVEYNKPSKISKFFNSTIRGKVFKPDYFNIKGNIGNKEVAINLPNAPVPNDEDEKDMYSLLLFDNGCGVRTFNNNIIGLGYSNENRTNIKRHLDHREQKFDENVKPLVMQSISMIASVALGALLAKVGFKH